jgi:hypothetical protein
MFTSLATLILGLFKLSLLSPSIPFTPSLSLSLPLSLSHFLATPRWDAMHNGMRFMQAPLAYPRERDVKMNGGDSNLPLLIYCDQAGFPPFPLDYRWSTHYREKERQPENLVLAPWVEERYKK